MVGKPSGVVTFLFTDIEGSTRRWESDADSMRRALVAHDEVMRDTVAAHNGWLFKHTGDGVCAAFGSPRSAVDAAVAAQRALELPVRMGVATGEAELRGEDYFGTVLNRAARVMSAGHGGQILVDGLTAGLLTGVELESHGVAAAARHRQAGRGVPGPGGRADVRLSAAEDRGFDAGQPAATDHPPDRPGSRTRRCGRRAQGTPAGDADRCRRGGEDATGARGGSAVRRPISPTAYGSSN